jgi:hypothetical protein
VYLQGVCDFRVSPRRYAQIPERNTANMTSHMHFEFGHRVRVQGLAKSTEYNGLFGSIDAELDGGRYTVFLEDGREISLKSENLLPVALPQEQDSGLLSSPPIDKNGLEEGNTRANPAAADMTSHMHADMPLQLATCVDGFGNFEHSHSGLLSSPPWLRSIDQNGFLGIWQKSARHLGPERNSRACPRQRESSKPSGERALLLRDLEKWAQQEARQTTAQDLSMMLWCLASVGSQNQELMRALAVRANALAKYFTASQMAMSWRALGRLSVAVDTAMVGELLQKVEELAPQLLPRHAGQIWRAMCKCGVRNSRAFAVVRHRIASRCKA